MKNKQNGFVVVTLAVVVLLAVTGGIYFYVKNNSKTAITEDAKAGSDIEGVNNDTNKINNVEDSKNVSKISTAKTEVIKDLTDTSSAGKNDDLWTIFDQVTLALKNKDIASYNKYSYKQVTPEEISDFTEFIPYLLDMNSKINKGDYVNKWQDDKQAVFSKNITKTSSGYEIERIEFIKQSNSWKLITVSSLGFVGTPTPDSDKDGLTDSEETCTANHDPSCVKTDPNKKDTNGDGWWDGINAVINK